MFDAGILFIGMPASVLIGAVGGNLGGNLFGNQLVHPIRVSPGDVAELVVECLEDIGEPVEFGLRLMAAAGRRYRLDLRVLVWQLDLHRRLLLNTITVHINRFENAFREIFLLWCRQLGHEEVQEDRQLLPFGVGIRQDR